jgi:type II secretory pathway pseudopilin PulG
MDSTFLVQRIDLLQKKVDSLTAASLMDQANFKLSQQQVLINQIDLFYNNAWTKLIIVITVLGIAVPILVNLLQRKSLKDLVDLALRQVGENYDSKIKELETRNDEQIGKLTDEYKGDLAQLNIELKKHNDEQIAAKTKELDDITQGNLYHLQSLIYQDKYPALAFAQALMAAATIMDYKENRTERAMNNAERFLKKVKTKDDLEYLKKDGFDYSKSFDRIKKSRNFVKVSQAVTTLSK